MLLIKCFISLIISQIASAEEAYSPDQEPPPSGYSSALKYFQKGPDNSTTTSAGNYSSGGTRMIFLDNVVFVDNNPKGSLDTPGQWGLNLGLEWDSKILGEGLYINYADYTEQNQFSVLYGFFYPRLQTRFPMYIKGNLGLGYFTGDFSNETLALDYNLFSGLHFFTRHNILFNIEFGSKNYTRFFSRSQLNSFVLSSGLAVVF